MENTNLNFGSLQVSLILGYMDNRKLVHITNHVPLNPFSIIIFDT